METNSDKGGEIKQIIRNSSSSLGVTGDSHATNNSPPAPEDKASSVLGGDTTSSSNTQPVKPEPEKVEEGSKFTLSSALRKYMGKIRGC